jgi:hypothetical protein
MRWLFFLRAVLVIIIIRSQDPPATTPERSRIVIASDIFMVASSAFP